MEGFSKWQKFQAAFIFKHFFYVKRWYFIFQSEEKDVNRCKCV